VFDFSFDFGLSVEPKPHRHIESKECAQPVRLVMSRTGRLSCEDVRFDGYLGTWDVGICGPVPLRTPATSLAKRKGTIEAEIVAHNEGNASVLDVRKSDFTPEITDAALADLREWRFAPALKDGKPVSVKVSVTLSSDGVGEKVAFRNLVNSDVCFDFPVQIVRP